MSVSDAQYAELLRRIEELEGEPRVGFGHVGEIRKSIEDMNKDYYLEVARGNIPGVKGINKFGKNEEIDSTVVADIWSRGKTLASGGTSLIWVAPTAARIHSIVSDDDDDGKTASPNAAGARTVKVYGLTSWTATETSETVTMAGTDGVNTNGAYVIIHRMKVMTSGGVGGVVNQGLITAVAAGDATITAAIEIGEGQTEMAIYGIPSIETIYINRIGVSMNKSGGAAALIDIDLHVNQEPDAQLLAFVHKHHIGLQSVGASSLIIRFDPPKKIAGPAIVKLQAESSTNDVSISGWFDGVVVDN